MNARKIGLGIAIFWAMVCVLSLFFIKEPLDLNLSDEFVSPSLEYWLGTTVNGVDVWKFLVAGAKRSLGLSLFSAVVCAILAMLVGALGYLFGRKVDRLVFSVISFFQALPGFLIFVMVSVFSGTSALGVIFSLVLAYWAGFARMMRALIQQFSEREFVLAHQSLGATLFQTFRVCILPNVLGPFVVYFCHRLKIFILSESAMSFLGFGYEPGTPSWGALIAQGRDSTLFAPHVLIVGSLALLSLLFAVEAVATSCENLLKSQKPG